MPLLYWLSTFPQTFLVRWHFANSNKNSDKMPKRILLPNGCSCSQISVFPKNWNTKKASIKRDWYLHYRFYDPNFEKPKQRSIRGMNEFKTREGRQEATRSLIENELRLLKELQYNPITGFKLEPERVTNYEIEPQTPFVDALTAVQKKLHVSDSTKKDVKSMIKGVKKASMTLHMNYIPVCEIRRKHIKRVLEQCEKLN